VTRAGKLYQKIMSIGFITRWLLFMVPVAILLAIPIIVGAFNRAEIAGVRILWFFLWIEVVWLGLWVAKLVARLLPYIFRSVVGVVSVSTAKYATLIKALDAPLTFLFWSVICVATFLPIMTQNPDNRKEPGGTKPWESIMAKLLTAAVLASAVYLGEKILIQLIAVHFHKVQYEMRITENKWAVNMFTKLLEHSRTMFPRFGGDFDEEDAVLEPGAFSGLRTKAGRKQSTPGTPGGTVTPMQFVNGARRVLQVGAGVLGGVAGEVTGKGYNQAGSPYQIVVEALLTKNASEALARRIWLSFVQEGNEALLPEDMIDVFDSAEKDAAEAAFTFFDDDYNGDVSLDEIIMKIHEVARERKAISSSLKDTDSAIGKLDNVFCLIVFVIAIFILIALLDTSFKTILTTSATGLLSLSFIFGATCQEIVASLIFVFVKHPFDVADRCIISGNTYIVQEMSLMFTILKRGDGTQVQAPNSLLNTLFIDNVRRSAAMLETVKIDVDFATSFEQIELLRLEMLDFVRHESRDFHNAFDISIDNFAGLSKMTISMAIKHKSNWQNDALRCQRRNKWMCALALAIKKLNIVSAGPGAGDS
ncbi:Mechanosensitive ion channel-domain-containing protein, partial [Protomyces lactucae-debilis]